MVQVDGASESAIGHRRAVAQATRQPLPRRIGVRLHSLHDQIVPDTVEELLDVEIDHPDPTPAPQRRALLRRIGYTF